MSVLSLGFSIIGDALNPLLVKDFRQAVRSRYLEISLCAILGLQLFVLWTTLGEQEFGIGRGLQAFNNITSMLVFVVLLGIPISLSSRIAKEKADNRVDLIGITTLTPTKLVAGWLQNGMAQLAMLLSTSLPFLVFTYILRGVDLVSIGLSVVMLFLVGSAAILVGIFLISVPGPNALRKFVAAWGYLGLAFVAVMVSSVMRFQGGFPWRLMFGSLPVTLSGWTQAGLIAGGVILTLLCLAQVFSLAVACNSSPRSNRAPLSRIIFLIIWLVSLAMALGSVSAFSNLVPMYLWAIGMQSPLGFAAMVSICERDSLGPRVRRQVPASVPLRPLVFPFFSGAGSGIVYTGILIVLTTIITLQVESLFPAMTLPEEFKVLIELVEALPMGFAVAMLPAMAIRRFLGISTGWTWLISFVVTYLVAFIEIAFFGASLFTQSFTSPDAFLEALTQSSGDAVGIDASVVDWGLLTFGIVFNAKWFLGYLRSFAPPPRHESPSVSDLTLPPETPASGDLP